MEQQVHFDVRSDFEIRAIVNPKADKTQRYVFRVFPKWLDLKFLPIQSDDTITDSFDDLNVIFHKT